MQWNSDWHVGNAATFYFLPMVLIASVVGLASTLAGIHHLRVWRTESLAAAASAALIAWTLTLLAFGYAKPEQKVLKKMRNRSFTFLTVQIRKSITAFKEIA